MRKLLLVALVATISMASDIVGGFGLKLGDKLDENTIIRKTETTSGDALYEVAPKKKVKFFDKYHVQITPKSKLIREIWGSKKYDSMGECKSKLETIKIIMEKKYGKFEKPAISFMGETFYKDIGSKSIYIRCTGFTEGEMYLKYIDEKLNKKAKMEEAKEESKAIGDAL